MNEEKATVVENEAVKVIDNEETIRESFMPDNESEETIRDTALSNDKDRKTADKPFISIDADRKTIEDEIYTDGRFVGDTFSKIENVTNAIEDISLKDNKTTKSIRDIENDTGELVLKPKNTIFVDIPAEAEDEDLDYIVELSSVYKFEGKLISKLDLRGLEAVNYFKMQEIDKVYKKLSPTFTSTPELTPEYAIAAAQVLTGLPLEFFKYLSGRDIRKIRTRVINFFYKED